MLISQNGFLEKRQHVRIIVIVVFVAIISVVTAFPTTSHSAKYIRQLNYHHRLGIVESDINSEHHHYHQFHTNSYNSNKGDDNTINSNYIDGDNRSHSAHGHSTPFLRSNRITAATSAASKSSSLPKTITYAVANADIATDALPSSSSSSSNARIKETHTYPNEFRPSTIRPIPFSPNTISSAVPPPLTPENHTATGTSTKTSTKTKSKTTKTKSITQEVELVDISWLKPHEEVVSEERVQSLIKATIQWNAYKLPLLVDKISGAILDGHHRYAVGCEIGLKKLPVILVDYLHDESIDVTVWPGCGRDEITKEDVVNMSLSDEVYPPKTSRHNFVDSLVAISVPLLKLW